ncbi:hypothetical protein ACH5RR_001059 [Cinchona calisaya]|uniref:Uncharacterized protein n=1 Tax=Cinchona calisaya TaxID=153742 RepID=A0ABD3B342_9GENT
MRKVKDEMEINMCLRIREDSSGTDYIMKILPSITCLIIWKTKDIVCFEGKGFILEGVIVEVKSYMHLLFYGLPTVGQVSSGSVLRDSQGSVIFAFGSFFGSSEANKLVDFFANVGANGCTAIFDALTIPSHARQIATLDRIGSPYVKFRK